MSYPPPQGPWPPPGYGPPFYPYQPVQQVQHYVEEPEPLDNRNLIVLLAIGLPLLLLSACGALFFVLTDEGRPESRVGETVQTQVVEDNPPDIKLNLSPPADQPTQAP
ncbi:hypothetical protein ACIBIZ_34570 [Nonomuraea spiralis]|uniref:hypothetical protein n=1 Tax=Nonomuraea TaxID=83681 RepID=UPI000F78EBF5|nr:hypothetical protein [Nonomuraea sp. WAC 01424]RSN03522.1 hypothetical protein DMB42_32890 [Nonomuraea sp. WAC 01424]